MKKTFIASELASRKGSKEKMFNHKGELNANSKKDAIQAIASLAQYFTNGDNVISEETAATKEQQRAIHRELIQSAFNSYQELASLGEVIATQLTQTGNRSGFARNLCLYQALNQGERPSVRMTFKNVTASVATGPVKTQTQIVRDGEYYPQEFYINARAFIEKRDLMRTNVDIVEQKYEEALENIVVVEDRTWKQAADSLVNVSNPHYQVASAFTPQIFAKMVTDLSNWGLSGRTTLMASNVMNDLLADPTWQAVLDPVSQQEILLTGTIGTVYGTSIVTDHYRVEPQRVLSAGEIYVVASPEQHGAYTDRGGVESQPIDQVSENIPGKGWVFNELFSLILTNDRSIVKATRIGR